MAVNGAQMIGTVLEHLRPDDIELLLANRGLPSVGGKEELADRLHSALQAEICEWEWEQGDVPEFHCGKAPLTHVLLHPQRLKRLVPLQRVLILHVFSPKA